ncbi:unnamed protein product, partial [Lymnaea stagnalis]
MPVGNFNTSAMKSKKKEDTFQKVLEIKQRQQNWLRQRDQSQKDDSKPKSQQPVSSKTTHSNIKPSEIQASKTKASGPVDLKSKANVRDKFNHWINVRNNFVKDEESDLNDNNSICSGAESELERLVSPELDPFRLPTEEQDFTLLADQIAKRVKDDLGFSHLTKDLSESVSSGASTSIPLNESRRESLRCLTFTQDSPTFGLTSHSCSVCKNLMLSSKNIPMMVIPCGHTLCKACSQGRQTCTSCDCPVVSLTVNIMLQQVIQEYHAKTHLSTSNGYPTQTNSMDGTKSYSSSKYVDDNKPYHMQLSNLQTRHDILSTEHTSLLTKQRQVLHRLRQECTQVQNIKRQEDELEKTVAELQDRLKSLKSHRYQYDSKVLEL